MVFMNSYKRLTGIVLIIMGTFSIIYSLVAKSYHVSFSGFFMPLGLFLLAAGILKLVLKSFKSKFMIYAVEVFRILIFFGFLSFIIVECLILGSAFKKDKNRPDYIVILGAGLWGDRPSLVLQQRLNTSLELIKLYPDVKIIVSGGQGPGETISEAEAMRRFLIKKGIDENRIMAETKSTNTLENLYYTKNLISKNDNRKNITITIITNNFHMFRSKFLTGRVGLKALGYAAPLKLYLIPAYYIREYFGVIKSALLDFPNKVMPPEIGVEIDSYKGVEVYNNGKDYAKSYGKNYSKDGYYYGYK